ncbi:hypothetical protein [Actinoplanes sp. NPDC026619]
MTFSLICTVLVVQLVMTVVLAAVYLWSGNDGIRRRAWRLLRFLHRR